MIRYTSIERSSGSDPLKPRITAVFSPGLPPFRPPLSLLPIQTNKHCTATVTLPTIPSIIHVYVHRFRNQKSIRLSDLITPYVSSLGWFRNWIADGVLWIRRSQVCVRSGGMDEWD